MYQPFGFFAAAADSGIGYGNPPYDQDLVAYYDFGDNSAGSWTGGASLSNGNTVTDLSGNGFDSTLNAGSQTWTYESGVGKGVISTTSKAGGYFYMDALSGAFATLTAYTFEFACYIQTDLTNDNLLMRFDGTSFSRIESNIQQYGGSPVPNRIGFDTITEQNQNVGVGTTNQDTGTGFLHMVYTAGQGDTAKVYYQGSVLGTSGTTMSGTDTFEFDKTGATSDTNAWFGTSNYSGGTFPGQIGVFRLYSSVMSATDVLANYNFYSPQF